MSRQVEVRRKVHTLGMVRTYGTVTSGTNSIITRYGMSSITMSEGYGIETIVLAFCYSMLSLQFRFLLGGRRSESGNIWFNLYALSALNTKHDSTACI